MAGTGVIAGMLEAIPRDRPTGAGRQSGMRACRGGTDVSLCAWLYAVADPGTRAGLASCTTPPSIDRNDPPSLELTSSSIVDGVHDEDRKELVDVRPSCALSGALAISAQLEE